MTFWVYILECYINGKFSCYYTGQTNNLNERMQEHYESVREHDTDKFVGRFDYIKLVWFKKVPTREDALRLENYLKNLDSDEKEDYMEDN